MKYTVRYYQRYPIDPKARWEIHREVVIADSIDEAIKLVADTHIEIIDAEEYHEPQPADPRTPEQIELDDWQAEWQSTYEEMRMK